MQDIGMIKLRNKKRGEQLAESGKVLFTTLNMVINGTVNLSDSLILSLNSFHDDVESAGKEIGLYE